MKAVPRLTRQQARRALRQAKTATGRAKLQELLKTNEEAWDALDNLVDLGVMAPHVLKEREDVAHNLRVLRLALGRMAA